MCPGLTGTTELRALTTSGKLGEVDPNWFVEERFLGKRGYKYMTPATKYLLAASAAALSDAGLSGNAYEPQDRGVVVGTNFAVLGTLDEMDRTILSEGADALRPMHAPNFSVNIPASYVSIQHHCRAFNVSFTDTIVAGLHALFFGAQALQEHRARVVIAAATEDAPPATFGLTRPASLPGACALTLEQRSDALRRGARIWLEFNGGSSTFLSDRDFADREATRRCLEPAIASLGLSRTRPIAYACVGLGDALHRQVDATLQELARSLGLQLSPLAPVLTERVQLSVSPLLEVCAAAVQGRDALLVGTSPQGHVAMLCVRSPKERA